MAFTLKRAKQSLITWAHKHVTVLTPLEQEQVLVLACYACLAFAVFAITLIVRLAGVPHRYPAYALAGTTFNALCAGAGPFLAVRFGSHPRGIERVGSLLTFGMHIQSLITLTDTERIVLNSRYINAATATLLIPLMLGNRRVLVMAMVLRTITSAVIVAVTPTDAIAAVVEFMACSFFLILGLLACRLAQFREDNTRRTLKTNSYITSLLFHETRTPMQCILNATYELNDKTLSPERHDGALDELVKQVNNITAIQTIINEFQHIDDMSPSELVVKSCHVRHRLARFTQLYKKRPDIHANALQVSFESDIPPATCVSLSWQHLQYSLTMLFDSIVRHTTFGSITLHACASQSLQLRVHLRDSQSRARVKASGAAVAAMAESEFVKMASRLFQSDAYLNHLTYSGGVDPALVLSRRVLDMMGATYTFSAETVSGSCETACFSIFMNVKDRRLVGARTQSSITSARVTSETHVCDDVEELPDLECGPPPIRLRRVVPEVLTDCKSEDSVTDANGQTQKRRMKEHPVLVVDDNSMIVRVLSMLLQALGYKTVHAADGLQAIEAVQTHRPCLVFMDLQMPNMNGIDAVHHIRTKLELPMSALPIVAVSAGGLLADVSRCKEAGFNGYYTKPIGRKALSAAVDFHLRNPSTWRVGSRSEASL